MPWGRLTEPTAMVYPLLVHQFYANAHNFEAENPPSFYTLVNGKKFVVDEALVRKACDLPNDDHEHPVLERVVNFMKGKAKEQRIEATKFLIGKEKLLGKSVQFDEGMKFYHRQIVNFKASNIEPKTSNSVEIYHPTVILMWHILRGVRINVAAFIIITMISLAKATQRDYGYSRLITNIHKVARCPVIKREKPFARRKDAFGDATVSKSRNILRNHGNYVHSSPSPSEGEEEEGAPRITLRRRAHCRQTTRRRERVHSSPPSSEGEEEEGAPRIKPRRRAHCLQTAQRRERINLYREQVGENDVEG